MGEQVLANFLPSISDCYLNSNTQSIHARVNDIDGHFGFFQLAYFEIVEYKSALNSNVHKAFRQSVRLPMTHKASSEKKSQAYDFSGLHRYVGYVIC